MIEELKCYKSTASNTIFKTCAEAFSSIGLIYDKDKYVCYNEDIKKDQLLCPFAKNDECVSAELPNP